MLVHFPRLSAHLSSLPRCARLYSWLRPDSLLSITGLRSHTLSIKSITMPAYNSTPGADQFYPLNEPAIGTAYPEVCHSNLALCMRMVDAALTPTGIPECLSAECPATHSFPAFDYQGRNLQEQNLRRMHSISHP